MKRRKFKMNKIKLALAFVFVFVLVPAAAYSLISFVLFEHNPGKWPLFWRFTFSAYCIFWFVFVIKKGVKNEN
jgi:hypothetical protein